MYSSREVADLLDIDVSRIRRYAREGLLSPERSDDNRYQFTFQDLSLLRTATELTSRLNRQRVHRALRELRRQLPAERALSEVSFVVEGNSFVVRDGQAVWNPESGQVQMDFAAGAATVATLPPPVPADAAPDDATAEDWFARGCACEATEPRQAMLAYRRVLTAQPDHIDARINLGRVMHALGDARAAAEQYQLAVAGAPENPTASFNLGVALQDMGRAQGAIEAYRHAVHLDPTLADAHYNLSQLYESIGDKKGALRHLQRYRQLL